MHRARLGLAALVVVGALAGPVVPASGAIAAAPPERSPWTVGLDGVVSLSPEHTCLRVEVEGSDPYAHRDEEPLQPASTEKLLTAEAVLTRIPPTQRFATTAVATGPVQDGVVRGDLTIVGGGDPLLTTDAYRKVRQLGPEQPLTSLEGFVDRIVAAGVRRIEGRVVGDEHRYDQLRTVPTWPERFVRQNQSGPLSALSVDDGFSLKLEVRKDGSPLVVKERAADPAQNAARIITERLRLRGVTVVGEPASGTAPAGATTVASTASAPLREVVRQMLQFSDNQTAELLTKELGVRSGKGGSTAAGVAVIRDVAARNGTARPGVAIVDGSGLDPGNRATCGELVHLLTVSGGRHGRLGSLLAVAGRSGTLEKRFRGTPAEGRLVAKTGRVNGVTALAGFVDAPDGTTATFAYIANGPPVTPEIMRAQDLLGAVLASQVAPCPTGGPSRLVAPTAPYSAGMAALAMFPLQSVLVPGSLLSLHVFEDRYKALVDRCLAADEDFGVVLISRGSEVGGEDQRTSVGTRAAIVRAEQVPDGRWALVAVGTERIRVDAWLPDDPHPIAEVAAWPDPEPVEDQTHHLLATGDHLARVLALHRKLGDPGPAPVAEVGPGSASLASHRLAALAPVGPLDRQRLLAAPDVPARLDLLDDLLADDEAVCRARLGGTMP